MHEYPILIYFFVFVLLLFFFQNISLILLAFLVFLAGLYADVLFRALRLKRFEFEYPHVFVLPFGKNAYAFGNSILIGKKLLEEDPEIIRAILYHELGHIRGKDFTTVFLLIFVYNAVLTTKSIFLIGAYALLFAWIYWQMEVRSDLFAKSCGANIEKALQKFNIRWRLYFLKNIQNTSWQETGIYITLVFLLGLYLGVSLKH